MERILLKGRTFEPSKRDVQPLVIGHDDVARCDSPTQEAHRTALPAEGVNAGGLAPRMTRVPRDGQAPLRVGGGPIAVRLACHGLIRWHDNGIGQSRDAQPKPPDPKDRAAGVALSRAARFRPMSILLSTLSRACSNSRAAV